MTSTTRRQRPAGKTPPATVVQKAAEQAGVLTEADREALRHEATPGNRHIVADRLLSMNGLISALLLLYSAWALRYPQGARRAWQRAQEWSMGWPLPAGRDKGRR